MTEVSVIVPTYLGADWIRECINSVLDQVYVDLEVIVVNDASPDDAAEIVAGMDDDRIRLVCHEENKGVPAARNTGIKEANGDYIAFLDQDDMWRDQKLTTQLNVFEEGSGDLGVVHGDAEIIGTDKETSWSGPLSDDPQERVRALFLRNPITTITALIDARCFETHGLLDEDLYGVDDYEFWLRIAEDYRIKYCPGVVAAKRVHESNTSDRFEQMNEDKMIIAKRYLRKYPYLRPLQDRKFHEIMNHYARNYADTGDYTQAIQYDLKALNHVKTSPTDYLRLGRDLVWAARQRVREVVTESASDTSKDDVH